MVEDSEVDRILAENPLMAFSIYTEGQVQSLRLLRNELSAIYFFTSSGELNPNPNPVRYLQFFWFWVLGAYEVLRTMDQASTCFTEPLREKIGQAKRRISKLRVPFAKQELAGEPTRRRGEPERSTKFYAENSALVHSKKGFGYRVGGEMFYSEVEMKDFFELIDSIQLSDILHSLPNGGPEMLTTD